jgi:hypothetical protein
MPDEGSKFSDDEKDATSNHKLKFPWGLGGGGGWKEVTYF